TPRKSGWDHFAQPAPGGAHRPLLACLLLQLSRAPWCLASLVERSAVRLYRHKLRKVKKVTVTVSGADCMTEKEKMLAGELYRSTDPELQAAMAVAQQRLRELNSVPNEDFDRRFAALRSLFAAIGPGTQLRSPFECDYGVHTRIGRNGFINFDCVFLDCNLI